MKKDESGLPFPIPNTIFCLVHRGQKSAPGKSHLGLSSTAFLMLQERAILLHDIA